MKENIFWEIFGYITILMVVVGQVIVGWVYVAGQCCFVVGNSISTIRCFKIQLPTADKVKNICFLAISISLVIVGLVK